MSNRKIFGALSILLLAILFMSIGCGDGKRNSKANPRKAFPGKGINGGSPEEIKKKAQMISTIEREMDAELQAGTPVAANGLEDGTYVLEEMVANVRYMRNSDDLNAIGYATNSNGQVQQRPGKEAGMMGQDADEPRHIDVPLNFSVTGRMMTAPAADQMALYNCQLDSGVPSKVVQSLAQAGQASELNLVQLARGGQNAINLSGGRKAEFAIRAGQGTLRFSLVIREKKKSKVGNRDADMIKKIVFVYKKQGAAASQQQQQQQQQEQQPGTDAAEQQRQAEMQRQQQEVELERQRQEQQRRREEEEMPVNPDFNASGAGQSRDQGSGQVPPPDAPDMGDGNPF